MPRTFHMPRTLSRVSSDTSPHPREPSLPSSSARTLNRCVHCTSLDHAGSEFGEDAVNQQIDTIKTAPSTASLRPYKPSLALGPNWLSHDTSSCAPARNLRKRRTNWQNITLSAEGMLSLKIPIDKMPTHKNGTTWLPAQEPTWLPAQASTCETLVTGSPSATATLRH